MTNPEHWFSELQQKPINLFELDKEQLIKELQAERLEYLAFENELSRKYGFKKREFPD